MAVKDMPIALAHLLGFGFSLLLYGAYTCIFAITIRFLALRKRTSKSRVVFMTILGLFLATSTTIVLGVIDNVNGFYTYRETPGTDSYFNDLQNGVRVTKDLLLLIAAIMADALICWRLFVIWGRNYRILIAPGFILFAEAVVGLLTVAFEFHEVIYSDGKYQTIFRVGSVFICICSALVNLLVTSLIVFRLWWVGRRVQDPADRNKYRRIIRALIESGGIYTAVILVFFICVVSNLRGAYTFVNYIVAVAVAIAPTLIVLHLNYPSTRSDENASRGPVPSTSIRFYSPSARDMDDLSMQASPDYDFSPRSYGNSDLELSPTYQPDRYTRQPTIKHRRSAPSHLRPHPPPIDVDLELAHISTSSLATQRSPDSARRAKGRLRGSTSHPSFRMGLGYSDVSLSGAAIPQGPDSWFSLSHALDRVYSAAVPSRDNWRSMDLEPRGPSLSPDDFRGRGPSSTAVDAELGAEHDPTVFLPPLPSPTVPSPTLAGRPSMNFAERAMQQSIRERPSEEGIELTRFGSAL